MKNYIKRAMQRGIYFRNANSGEQDTNGVGILSEQPWIHLIGTHEIECNEYWIF